MTLTYGDTRSDGFRFIRYYKRNNKIYQEWASPERFINAPRYKEDPDKRIRDQIRGSMFFGSKANDALLAQAKELVRSAIKRGLISYQ